MGENHAIRSELCLMWRKVEENGACEAVGKGVVCVFLGTYTPKIDDKNRFFLPSKYRDQLANGLVIAPFHDGCLAVYPIATFERMAEEITSMPVSYTQVRAYQRQMASEASHEKPDKQGRVHIAPHLRAFADLDGQIMVRGVMDRLELWNPQRWAERCAEERRMYTDMDSDIWPKRDTD